MSAEQHTKFHAHHGGYWITVDDQLDAMRRMTIPELQAVAADKDLGVTVRKAAERAIRRLQRGEGVLTNK
jgi:hypothetical protein